jgi:hypothetical protein
MYFWQIPSLYCDFIVCSVQTGITENAIKPAKIQFDGRVNPHCKKGLQVGTGQILEESCQFLTTLLDCVLFDMPHTHDVPARQG